MTTQPYLLTAISNLHAGSGDTDFGIVDKHVQRDAVSQLPTIHASSIKGALREVFTTKKLLKPEYITEVFGTENIKSQQNNLQQGATTFYNAQLLALPVRSSHRMYYLATCPELIADFLSDLQRFNAPQAASYEKGLRALADLSITEGTPQYFDHPTEKVRFEDLTAKYTELPLMVDNKLVKKLFGDRLALLHCNDLARLSSELPVIARNQLNNGISNNLWYEEVVPRESRFWLFLQDETAHMEAGLKKIEHRVQIGGNATVGYGYCELQQL